MKYRHQWLALLAAPVAFAWLPGAMRISRGRPVEHISYKVVKRILIDSGGAGFLAVDPGGRRLYGASNSVIDLDHQTVVGTLPLHSGYGFALALNRNLGISRVGYIFHLGSLEKFRQLDMVAHVVAYDAQTQHAAFVGSAVDTVADATSARIVDLDSGRIIGTTDLQGEPNYVIGDGSGHFLITHQQRRSVVEISAVDGHLLNEWNLGACEGPHGEALNADHSYLLVSCEQHIITLDMRSGHVADIVATKEGESRQVAFDSATGLFFVPHGAGRTTIVRLNRSGTITVAGSIASAEASNFAVVDQATHWLYMYATKDKGLQVIVLAPSDN